MAENYPPDKAQTWTRSVTFSLGRRPFVWFGVLVPQRIYCVQSAFISMAGNGLYRLAAKGEIPMIRFVASQFAIVALWASASFAFTADERPELKFTQDGEDLVVSTMITVNNSSHALWTHATFVGNNMRLSYQVFQNRDLLVRSQKQIEVQWRLVGHTKGDETYHVEQRFLPSSAELKELLPQLQKLMEEGERLRRN
jgi:hypothetical protein